jgi:aspartate aminotransferase
MDPQISQRGRRMPASPIRKLAPLADAAKRRGTRVHHLNIGQPDLETPAVMRARLASAPQILAYTPSGGTAECVASLQGYYRRHEIVLDSDDIVVTTGGSEAILFAMTACAGEGDEALVSEPFYTNYMAFATMAGLRLVPLLARAEDGFHLPPIEEWSRALTPRTRLVLLCNPNNPTGTVYRREEVEAIAAFCREHGLFLISDEVYREFVYDGRRATSALHLPDAEEIAVVVDSLSKRYSACGIRLGCVATRNRAVSDACLRMAQGRLSPPALAQLVALGASELGLDYAEGVVREYQARRDVLFEGLARLAGVFLRKPEGAFYFVARLPVEDSEDFASWLLTDFSLDGATVMVAPAPGFYATPGLGRDEVRIAYVLNTRDLEASVRILAHALPAYRAARGLGSIEAPRGAAAEAR